MTLATHAVAGAALASLMPAHPAAAFAAGFLSHFLLDAIPHWDYHLASSRKDEANPLNDDLVISRDFYFDLIKIIGDALLGLIVSWWWFGPYALIGAIGAQLPDLLQFAYFKLRGPILTPLQTFHQWIHTDYRIKKRPVLGISLQVLLVLAIIAILRS